MTLTGRRAIGACVLALAVCVALDARTAAAENFKSFKLKALDGEQKSLSQVMGKNATLVALFFPTCAYCNAAFPEVQKIYDTYKSRGLSLIWINVLPDEERLIADWRVSHGYTATILLGNRGVAADYDLRMTPTHYLLDATGKVLWTHAGYKPGDERDLDREIQRALAKTE